MSLPTTTTELAQYTEREILHSLASGTSSSQRSDIVGHLDRGNKIIHSGGGLLNYDKQHNRVRDDVKFVFATTAEPEIITLQAPLTSYKATITQNTNSLSFDSTISTDLDDWFIRIANDNEVYRITAHTAGESTATISGVYVNSDVSEATCDIFKLRYSMSNSVLNFLEPIHTFNNKMIDIVDRAELFERYPLQRVSQRMPLIAGVVNVSSNSRTPLLQFSHYPKNLERVEVPYVPVPSTLETSGPTNPVMPAEYRICLAHLAAYFIDRRNENDMKVAETHLETAREIFAELVEWNERLVKTGDALYGTSQGYYGTAAYNTRNGQPRVQSVVVEDD